MRCLDDWQQESEIADDRCFIYKVGWRGVTNQRVTRHIKRLSCFVYIFTCKVKVCLGSWVRFPPRMIRTNIDVYGSNEPLPRGPPVVRRNPLGRIVNTQFKNKSESVCQLYLCQIFLCLTWKCRNMSCNRKKKYLNYRRFRGSYGAGGRPKPLWAKRVKSFLWLY